MEQRELLRRLKIVRVHGLLSRIEQEAIDEAIALVEKREPPRKVVPEDFKRQGDAGGFIPVWVEVTEEKARQMCEYFQLAQPAGFCGWDVISRAAYDHREEGVEYWTGKPDPEKGGKKDA